VAERLNVEDSRIELQIQSSLFNRLLNKQQRQ
jgi:hypothetical protein